jgi:hypothetical protein
VRNRTQAVLVAQRRGFLPSTPAGLPPTNSTSYANAR